MRKEIPQKTEFEKKKTDYFVKLSIKVREALQLHKTAGLWQRNKAGKRDWGNVSEHCLVEVARVRIFARLLNLSEEYTRALTVAAAMHDFFKKGQKEIATAGELSRAAFAKASEEANCIMRTAGVNEGVMKLVNAVGDESLLGIQRVLDQTELEDDDIAFCIMHYVDDYTINAEWAQPHSFDKRMDAAEANPRYTRNNEEGRAVFNGETAYQAQRRIGHIVERRLAELITQKQGGSLDPLALPEFIDAEIKKEIETTKS